MMDACAFSLRQHFRLKERSVAGCRVGGVKEIFIWAFFFSLAGKQLEVSMHPDGDFREPQSEDTRGLW